MYLLMAGKVAPSELHDHLPICTRDLTAEVHRDLVGIVEGGKIVKLTLEPSNFHLKGTSLSSGLLDTPQPQWAASRGGIEEAAGEDWSCPPVDCGDNLQTSHH